MFVPGSVLKKLRKEAFAQMDQTKILKYRRTYEDPVKENDVASSQEQEDSKIQIAVSMRTLISRYCNRRQGSNEDLSFMDGTQTAGGSTIYPE